MSRKGRMIRKAQNSMPSIGGKGGKSLAVAAGYR